MNSSKRGAVYGFKLQSLDLVSGLTEMRELCKGYNSWQKLGPGALGCGLGCADEESPLVGGPVGAHFPEHHLAAST